MLRKVLSKMKGFNWLLIGLAVVLLAMVSLVGCVSKSEYEALQAEHAALVQEKASLTQEKASLTQENTSLKAEFDKAKSDLTSVEADYDKLEADYDGVKTDYAAASEELTEIKQVYPPRDFDSLSELEDWLRANGVSERPTTEFAEAWYRKALEIQEDALKDGYIVSADYDYDEEEDSYSIWCVTIIDGDIWYWDPETDEPYQDESLGKVK